MRQGKEEAKQNTALALSCGMTNYPTTWHQKITSTHYPRVSMSWESRPNLAKPLLHVLNKAVIKVLAQGLQSHRRDQPEEDTAPHSLRGCWQHIVPYGLLG